MRVSAEPMTSTNLYTTQDDDACAQPTYSGGCWPVVGQQTMYYRSSSLFNWDGSFTSTLAPEESTVVPNPSSGESLFHVKTLRA